MASVRSRCPPSTSSPRNGETTGGGRTARPARGPSDGPRGSGGPAPHTDGYHDGLGERLPAGARYPEGRAVIRSVPGGVERRRSAGPPPADGAASHGRRDVRPLDGKPDREPAGEPDGKGAAPASPGGAGTALRAFAGFVRGRATGTRNGACGVNPHRCSSSPRRPTRTATRRVADCSFPPWSGNRPVAMGDRPHFRRYAGCSPRARRPVGAPPRADSAPTVALGPVPAPTRVPATVTATVPFAGAAAPTG